jgi:uncharacterized membrane protein
VARIAETIVIQAPLDAVFAFHSDPTTAPRWSPHVTSVRDVAGDPTVAGSTWTLVGRIPPLPVAVEVRFRVMESQPPRLLRLAMSGAATATVTNRYEPLPDGSTRLEVISEYQPPATFFGRAVDGALVQRVLAADVQRSLRGLKQALEQGHHRTP